MSHFWVDGDKNPRRLLEWRRQVLCPHSAFWCLYNMGRNSAPTSGCSKVFLRYHARGCAAGATGLSTPWSALSCLGSLSVRGLCQGILCTRRHRSNCWLRPLTNPASKHPRHNGGRAVCGRGGRHASAWRAGGLHGAFTVFHMAEARGDGGWLLAAAAALSAVLSVTGSNVFGIGRPTPSCRDFDWVRYGIAACVRWWC